MAVHLKKTRDHGTHCYNKTRPPSPELPENAPRIPVLTDPKVQSQPEDGPHIGSKHVVAITLL